MKFQQIINTKLGRLFLICLEIKADDEYQQLFQEAYTKATQHFGIEKYFCLRQWWFIPDIAKNYKTFTSQRLLFFSSQNDNNLGKRTVSTCVEIKGFQNAFFLFTPVDIMVKTTNLKIPNQVPLPESYGYNYKRLNIIKRNNFQVGFISATAGLDTSGNVVSANFRDQFKTSIMHILDLIFANNFSLKDKIILIIYYIENSSSLLISNLNLLKKEYPNIKTIAFQSRICRKDVFVEMESLIIKG